MHNYKHNPTDLSELRQKFSDYTSTAFRFEGLQVYNVASEIEEYNLFESGKPKPQYLIDQNTWIPIIRTNINAGKTMQRVRFIIEPLTKYSKYEIEWGYKYSSIAGEKINIIQDLKQNDLPDFWLFDSEDLFIMIYDKDGTFLGTKKIIDKDGIKRFTVIARDLLSSSVSLNEYILQS